MLAVVGTVPDRRFPLTHGLARMDGDELLLGGRRIPVNRGTPALVAAALAASRHIDGPDVYAFLVGDIGLGDGSRQLYAYLCEHLPDFDASVLAFHYLQPDADWHNKVLFAVDAMKRRPLLIADAGFMYAAKMSGQAPIYDFFTPDVGELSFLADEMAPHPFYTRGFILHQNGNVPDLIKRAYEHHNAAATLLVKGRTDLVANVEGVIARVDQPAIETMEAIGGTGDTLTGLLALLCAAGMEPVEAAVLAATTNRWAGYLAKPTPATQVAALIDVIPKALAKAER